MKNNFIKSDCNKFAKLVLSISLLSMSSAYAQERPSVRQKSVLDFEEMNYAKAVTSFEKLVDRKDPKLEDMEKLAYCYLYLNQYDLAENWYARVIQAGSESKENILNYANVLKQQSKYDRAVVEYKKYLTKYGKDRSVEQSLMGAEKAVEWMSHPTFHQLKNEININTDRAEFSAFASAGVVYYAAEPAEKVAKSGMTGNSYLRLFQSSANKKGLLNDASMGQFEFNDHQYHVGPVIFNKAGDTMYLTRTYAGKESQKSKNKGYRWNRYNLELKVYKKTNGEWAEMNFPYNKVEAYSVGHAALSADEKTLFFVSDMPGGHGGADIWYSQLQNDGQWGAPINAGTKINTSEDELFPSVFNSTLFFASDGHVGMGGLDVFSVGIKDHLFSTVNHLGYPINSAADDFAYLEQESAEGPSLVYLSSNRKGGKGSDDLYSFLNKQPQIKITLKGKALNKNTLERIPNADYTLLGLNGQIVKKGVLKEDEDVVFYLDPKQEFVFLGEKGGFHSDSLKMGGYDLQKDTVIDYTVLLSPISQVGDRFILEDIYYDFDKSNIRPDAAKILNQLVATLRDNPTLKIELSSHTDSRGSDSYNEKLSQRRATSAVEYIISRGIARERLVAKGYGERRLVNKCSNAVNCTVEEHQANRRTEVEVLAY